MNYYYQLYGLKIQTTQKIPQLISAQDIKKPDVSIHFRAFETQKEYDFVQSPTAIYTSYGLAPNEIPYLSVWKQYENESNFLILRYTNGENTAFFVSDKNGENIKVLYHPTIPVDDMFTYFLGPVIGCILRLKNKVCLHASVVNINNQAIAFIGEKTAGKSTLIAHLAAKGYPVLSDDIAVLFEKEEQFFVHPGYPRLRLWQKSLEQFNNIKVNDLDPVLVHINKYYLPLSVDKKEQWKFQSTPLPLKAVIYLNPRNETDYLGLDLCKSLEGFLHLKKNIYAEYMLTSDLLSKEFKMIGRVAQQLPTLSLSRPDDLNYMEDTCELITKWVSTND